MTKSARNSRKASKAATEPRLGIFWLVNGELLTDSLILLRRFMRSLPIVFRVPPQSGESGRQSGWRFICSEGLAEVIEGHLGWFFASVDQ